MENIEGCDAGDAAARNEGNVEITLHSSIAAISQNSAAGELARALNARRSARGWMAACVSHRERTPSLHISEGDDGRVLVHCFAGCPQDAVLAELRARGLWNGHLNFGNHEQRRVVPRDDTHRIERITAIWNEACDPRGTLVQSYLASRNLDLPRELCGNTLRFHHACPWERDFVPCLLAPFRAIADNRITGIHRVRAGAKAFKLAVGLVEREQGIATRYLSKRPECHPGSGDSETHRLDP